MRRYVLVNDSDPDLEEVNDLARDGWVVVGFQLDAGRGPLFLLTVADEEDEKK